MYFLYALVMVISQDQSGSISPAVLALERGVLDSRKSIRRGIISFDTVIYMNGNTDQPYAEETVSYWFDLDRSKKRKDLTYRRKPQDSPAGFQYPDRVITCQNCEREGYFVSYNQMPPQKKGVSALTLLPLARMPQDRREMFGDPRSLGLIPSLTEVLYSETIEDYFAVPAKKRDQIVLRKDTRDGVDYQMLSYRVLPSEVRVDNWIIPAKGYSVARIVMRGSNHGKPWEVTLESVPRQVERSEYWFPSKITYVYMEEGKLFNKELVEVTKVSLNEPIDDKYFTLAGMDIAEGTPIVGPMENGQTLVSVWEKGAVVQRELNLLPSNPTMVGASTSRRTWVIVASISAVVAVLVAVYYVRRRVSKT